ncbi:hypothetical protein BH10BAC2_BH10BAC2_29350 [soil metagenome]
MTSNLSSSNFEEKKIDDNTIEISPKLSKKEKRRIRDLNIDPIVIQIDGFNEDDLNRLRELNVTSNQTMSYNSLLNKLTNLLKITSR